MNGKKQTHSLGLIMIQHGKRTDDDGDDDNGNEGIPRLKRHLLKSAELRDVVPEKYIGPKKPLMPPANEVQSVLPENIASAGEASARIATQKDILFLHDITNKPTTTPEHSGYNTKLARESGQSALDETTCLYTPLIDLPPAERSTIYTATLEAQKKTEETGQQYTILTFDQQLYKILIDLKWTYPKAFENVIARLGGMHLLMSFLGCIGSLMSNTGLDELMRAAFAGVDKMLLGNKYFPQTMTRVLP